MVQYNETAAKNDYILELKEISKHFYGIRALKNVDFKARRGKVAVLIGENGAGKSTLMRILAGAETMDKGSILIDGKEVLIKKPADSFHAGISMIYQELNLVPHMSVLSNIYLGREETRGIIVSYKKLYKDIEELFSKYHININPDTIVADLSVAKQQMVEIMKSVSRNARILVMDEPTSSLDNAETGQLFSIINQLKEEGVTIIYISHKMEELYKIGDYVTVLRDGMCIGEWQINNIPQKELISKMVGRDISQLYPKEKIELGEEVLRLENVSGYDRFSDISFSLHRGEILGFSGLVGAGRTELALSIFGDVPIDKGQIYIKGNPVKIKNPNQAIDLGIAYVPEDRKRTGVNLKASIRYNLSLPFLRYLQKFILLDFTKERNYSSSIIDLLKIKTPNDLFNVETLSGGNQQKVVLGKWLKNKPDILILDEPTRGVDVGAKQEIHRIIMDFAKQGVAIILISSEMPEVIGMSDRIAIMHEGRLSGIFSVDKNLTQERIMSYSIGLQENIAV
jgi:ABC-type sugar transport system ATPase subunit